MIYITSIASGGIIGLMTAQTLIRREFDINAAQAQSNTETAPTDMSDREKIKQLATKIFKSEDFGTGMGMIISAGITWAFTTTPPSIAYILSAVMIAKGYQFIRQTIKTQYLGESI